jgi:hypothetical protein
MTPLELFVLRQVLMLSLRMWLVGMLAAPLIPALVLLGSTYAAEKIRTLRRRGI